MATELMNTNNNRGAMIVALAKAHAIATYTSSHDTAEDYDLFVSMGSFQHDDNDFEIWEPFEGWDYEGVKELVEMEYRSIIRTIEKAVEL